MNQFPGKFNFFSTGFYKNVEKNSRGGIYPSLKNEPIRQRVRGGMNASPTDFVCIAENPSCFQEGHCGKSKFFSTGFYKNVEKKSETRQF